MASSQIDDTRITPLNDDDVQPGRYVLYWMQQSQRAHFNHALDYAIQEANRLDLPLLVGFGLTDDYPEANLRHYRFMVEGLADVQRDLEARNIRFLVVHGGPADVALLLARQAAMVVCDRGYLRIQTHWRDRVADEAGRRVVQVEADVVVPVEVVTDKAEHAARTLRPRITRHLDRYLVDLRTTAVDHGSLDLQAEVDGMDLSDLGSLLGQLNLDRSVAPNPQFIGGNHAAKTIFRRFLRERFAHYDAHRNHPETDDVSHMSKYLHFGQVSPVWLALEVRTSAHGSQEDRETFLEELIVRRELAQNFVAFTPDYDRFSCLPNWAKKTLALHKDDERPHRYNREQLIRSETHDPYWNAAMTEMRVTGYMHNYMRMYWGKKILEWSASAQQAYETTLAINNRFFIDGRDPNSYANVGWIFGLHDRAWGERPIFGKVRYMAASGLERKMDIDGYVRKVEKLADEVGRW